MSDVKQMAELSKKVVQDMDDKRLAEELELANKTNIAAHVAAIVSETNEYARVKAAVEATKRRAAAGRTVEQLDIERALSTDKVMAIYTERDSKTLADDAALEQWARKNDFRLPTDPPSKYENYLKKAQFRLTEAELAHADSKILDICKSDTIEYVAEMEIAMLATRTEMEDFPLEDSADENS